MGDVQTIDLQSAIRRMVSRAGKTYADVSRAIGRNDRYLSIMLNDATTPRVDLLARIAQACGYDLLLSGHGEAYSIEAADGEGPAARATLSRLYLVKLMKPTRDVQASEISDMIAESVAIDKQIRQLQDDQRRLMESIRESTGARGYSMHSIDSAEYDELKSAGKLNGKRLVVAIDDDGNDDTSATEFSSMESLDSL